MLACFVDFIFGVGENMLNTYLISCDHVECLFLPRLEFKRLGQLDRLNAIKAQLDDTIPTSQRLFDIYFSGELPQLLQLLLAMMTVEACPVPARSVLASIFHD